MLKTVLDKKTEWIVFVYLFSAIDNYNHTIMKAIYITSNWHGAAVIGRFCTVVPVVTFVSWSILQLSQMHWFNETILAYQFLRKYLTRLVIFFPISYLHLERLVLPKKKTERTLPFVSCRAYVVLRKCLLQTHQRNKYSISVCRSVYITKGKGKSEASLGIDSWI